MQEVFSKLTECISKAVSSCKSDCIALSGGLDSSILAYCVRQKKIKAIAIVTKDFASPDLAYSQFVAKQFGISLHVKSVTIEELMHAIEETIKILKIFNDIEIRNSIVMYLAIMAAKEIGCQCMMTGDGGDELFAGYSFFLKKQGAELQKDLERIWKIMHFPTQRIGQSLGIGIESPFLDKDVAQYAKSIPGDLKVREENGKKYGKWVLRKAFEDVLPKSIVWREKSAMQNGSGTNNLASFFENTIKDSVFDTKAKSHFEKDGVKLKSKESLFYYELYRKYYDPPALLGSSKSRCPDCQGVVDEGSHFCRMCGSFPI